jgi:hypothetical protein
MGTKGRIKGNMEENNIIVTDFLSRKDRHVGTEIVDGHVGHGGGDTGLMKVFCEYLNGEYRGNQISNVAISALSHKIAFAAEQSQVNGGQLVEL